MYCTVLFCDILVICKRFEIHEIGVGASASNMVLDMYASVSVRARTKRIWFAFLTLVI